MKAWKHLPVFSLLLGCCPVRGAEDMPYLPLQDATAVFETAKTGDRSIVSTHSENRVGVVSVFEVSFGAPGTDDRTVWILIDTGPHRQGLMLTSIVAGHGALLFEPALLLLPQNLTEGQEWRSEAKFPDGRGGLLKAVIEGSKESVQIEASGHSYKAREIRLLFEDKLFFRVWLARGVGIVRYYCKSRQDEQDALWDLVEVKPGAGAGPPAKTVLNSPGALKPHLFELAFRITRTQYIAGFNKALTKNERPEVLALVQTTLTWALDNATKLGAPTAPIKKLQHNLDRLPFEDIEEMLGEISVDISTWAGELNSQAPSLFVLGMWLGAAEATALSVRADARAAHPDPVDLIRRNTRWMIENGRDNNLGLSAQPAQDLLDDLEQGATFEVLYQKLVHLREAWQKELEDQPAFPPP